MALLGVVAAWWLLGHAYPNTGLWWAMPLASALLGLFVTLHGYRWSRVAVLFATAWVWWVWMCWWLSPVTFGGLLGLATLQAFFVTMGLLSAGYLHKRLGMAMTWALPIGWTSFEIIRSHWPAGGFPWLTMGYVVAPYREGHGPSRLAQIADIAGPHAVTFVLLLIAGLLVDAKWTHAHLNKSALARLRRLAITVVVVLAGVWGYGQWRINQTPTDTTADAGPRPITVALVQTNVPQDNKISPTREQTQADWDELKSATLSLADQAADIDLIIWPETILPRAINDDMIEYEGMSELRFPDPLSAYGVLNSLVMIPQQLSTPIVTGGHAYEDFQTVHIPGRGDATVPMGRYNSAYLIHTDGQVDPRRYDKYHRVPFGEYMPWIDGRPWLKQLFLDYISPYPFDYSLSQGLGPSVFTVPIDRSQRGELDSLSVLRLAVPICYEDCMPYVTRWMVTVDGIGEGQASGGKSIDLLVNLTNSAWYSGNAQRPQQLQMATYRCIETRTPMARAVNTGISALIASDGGLVAVLPQPAILKPQSTDVLVAPVAPDERITVYIRGGWVLPWVLVASTGLLLVIAAAKRFISR